VIRTISFWMWLWRKNECLIVQMDKQRAEANRRPVQPKLRNKGRWGCRFPPRVGGGSALVVAHSTRHENLQHHSSGTYISGLFSSFSGYFDLESFEPVNSDDLCL